MCTSIVETVYAEGKGIASRIEEICSQCHFNCVNHLQHCHTCWLVRQS